MKRMAATALGVLLLAPAATADHYLQTDPTRYDVGDAKKVRIEFPVGELTVEGTDGKAVEVSVRVRCKSGSYEQCEKLVDDVRIEKDLSGGRLSLEFKGFPKKLFNRIEVKARISVPRSLAADIEMGVGELTVEDLTGDLDVELGVGQVDIRLDGKHYASAEADVGVGDADIRSASGHIGGHGFISRSAEWSRGSGPSHVKVEVGVGEASLDMR